MLGSRKLLIILCIVPCVLSLVCIGAFAAPAEDLTPSVDIPIDTEVVEDVVKSPSALAEETFPAQPLLHSSYYKYSLAFASLPTSGGLSNVVGVSARLSDSAGGSYLFGQSFYVPVTLSRTAIFGSDSSLVWNDGTTSGQYLFNDAGHTLLSVLSTSSSLTIDGQTVQGTLVENDMIPDLAESVFDVGDALITFVVSSWVVIIPLAAWLVVLCIGAIRKLVKGV